MNDDPVYETEQRHKGCLERESKLEAESTRLRASNAELLVALKDMPVFRFDVSMPEGSAYESYLRQRRAAIANAEREL
mgnify:CR=1 FL=1